MSQTLVIKTAALPVDSAGLIVIYAGEGMPLRGSAADLWSSYAAAWQLGQLLATGVGDRLQGGGMVDGRVAAL